MDVIEAVRWSDDGAGVRILDQRELPAHEVYRDLRSIEAVHDAIATLAVRGAPAIGIAGAMGLALSIDDQPGDGARAVAIERLKEAHARLRSARPTAVNLAWAVDRVLSAGLGATSIRAAMVAEATRILNEDRAMCRAIGEHAATLIPDGARVLTHCNAGALATGGIGTALAGVYVAAEQGKRLEVFARETRPLLQGSRLTAWELARAGIPVTVVVDGGAASLMARGAVDLCIVGADRIVANGDTANKVGTYPLAIAARHHGIPFYVAAPASTFDPCRATGASIEIEERSADEVRLGPDGLAAVPADARVHNPAFDVTPATLITAIICDRGVVRPPYDFSAGGGPRERAAEPEACGGTMSDR